MFDSESTKKLKLIKSLIANLPTTSDKDGYHVRKQVKSIELKWENTLEGACGFSKHELMPILKIEFFN
jgi:hypothetical protein